MSTSASPANYRPDIDGLRGIAVLAVIVFHIHKAFLPGGFVGVDVFFVISGYLITRHIWQDLGNKRFSLLQFYCRRIKRIAPAMLVVVMATVVLAQLFLLPDDSKAVAKSAVWSLASMANIFFWLFQDTGYFAASSTELPLLHLWSLGVEEQFYLVWPLVAMAAYRVTNHALLLCALCIFTILSFLLGEWIFPKAPSFAYYMLPTRAGELLLGAAIAFAVESGHADRLAGAHVKRIAMMGAVLLGGSLAFISEGMVFPGLLAIPPTLGAALLILAGHLGPTRASQILSSKLLLWMGKVSYSAYLVHWPLLAFYRYGYGNVGMLTGVLMLVLTFLLAAVSYRYVEQPGRRYSSQPGRILLPFAGVSTAILLVALGSIYLDRLAPQFFQTPYRTELAAVVKKNRALFQMEYVCQHQRLLPADAFDARCVLGTGAQPARVLLWGDSNATHYVGVIGTFANERGFKVRNLEVGACPPVLGDIAEFVDPRRAADCASSQTVSKIALDNADVIIISAAWNTYQARSPSFMRAFFRHVRSLTAAGKKVILIGKVPEFEGFDWRCSAKELSVPFLRCPASRGPLSGTIASVNAELRAFARSTDNVTYFDAVPYLCPQGVCSTAGSDGQSMYSDASHLSIHGSWGLGQKIYAAEGVPSAFSAAWLSRD